MRINISSLIELLAGRSIKDSDRIIFLDFDGVLVPYNQTGKDCFGRLFDPRCTESLREIIACTGAKLVITSSWGNYMSAMKLRLMWRVRKLPGYIVDVLQNNRAYFI